MCKKLNEHFKKYNQMYSFGFLLIITLLVAFLFLKIDALETDVDKLVNEPNVNHRNTLEMIKRRSDTATVMTEVIVAPEGTVTEEAPGVSVPDGTNPTEPVAPNNVPSAR